jgi:hypothetical protein
MSWRLKSREQVEAELSLYNAAIDEAGGSYRVAAAALGIANGNALASRLTRLRAQAERGEYGTSYVIPTFAIKSVSTQIGPNGETQKEWIKQGPQAGDAFEVPEGHRVAGVSALVDGAGRTIQQWVKTKSENADFVIDALKTTFDQYKGRAKPVPAPKQIDADLMSVYPIADQHVGLMAWLPEAGENYDLKIGAARLRDCMARLIGQSPPSGQALILNLGDWTHQDDMRNMTPRSGHILDVDGRYFKVLTTGVQLMVDCIEMALAKHKTVLVRNIPGNHDPHASIALTVALGAFFANNPRVTVDDDPSEWFFHRFGQTLMGAHHGHRSKPADMAMTMAVRRRSDWGETAYHWMMFGHIHHETAKEVGDVRVESFQTLAAKDAYAAGHGYCSGQSLTSVTLHIEDGEIGRHRVNLTPALRAGLGKVA